MKQLMKPAAILRFILAAFLAVFFWTVPVQAQETNPVYTLKADGLACPFCAYGIEKQISKIESVEKVETDIKAGAVVVTMKEGASLNEAQAREAVEAAGFTLRGFERESGE
jgi:copper chaperone CopZ